jgi:hypothetical protein
LAQGLGRQAKHPVVEAPQGRRDDCVDPYFNRTKPDDVVVLFKGREPARIMTAAGDSKTNRWHLEIANRAAAVRPFTKAAARRESTL